jgi:hypothetical protein
MTDGHEQVILEQRVVDGWLEMRCLVRGLPDPEGTADALRPVLRVALAAAVLAAALHLPERAPVLVRRLWHGIAFLVGLAGAELMRLLH